MSILSYHRTRAQDQRLEGYECPECGWVSFPEQKRTCKRCGAADVSFKPVQLAREGTIQSFVVQSRLPEDFESPQHLAIVDLPQAEGDGEPARVFGLLVETDQLSVGDRVVPRFREMFTSNNMPIHSYKFGPPRGDD